MNHTSDGPSNCTTQTLTVPGPSNIVSFRVCTTFWVRIQPSEAATKLEGVASLHMDALAGGFTFGFWHGWFSMALEKDAAVWGSGLER